MPTKPLGRCVWWDVGQREKNFEGKEKRTKPVYTDICSVLHPHTMSVTKKSEVLFSSKLIFLLGWKTLFSLPKEREKTKFNFLDVVGITLPDTRKSMDQIWR